ncbi:MAG TPA: hypothetical protein ENI19_03535 [Candidatus Nealsonbacteria bacterium]|uniref:Uncharacterized protein n=1 Tax=marine sediment metagenome TaxID=412755 RepID=A0A0F9VSJ3_9ZZZZ|nr:hypothetical protein [Candidatus Nealsonbacteria bacterium]HEB46749.1 hypothetical protein [Candidatus Nealsonbacteria bacterium]
MDTFKGSPQDTAFQEWCNRLIRNKRMIVAVATDEISCYKARTTLKEVSSFQFSHTLENLKEAVVHVTTCWDQGCKVIFSRFLEGKQLKVS